MTVTYSENGICVPDNKAVEFAFNAWNKQNDIEISNEIIIFAFRLLVYNKTIPHKQLVFCFKGQIIEVDKDAKLINRPKGFCDTYINLLTKLF